MRSRDMLGGAGWIMALGAGLAAQANLLQDGGFEPSAGVPDAYPAAGPHLRFSALTPPANLGAWSMTGDYQVDLMGSGYLDAGGNTWNTAYEGDQYLYITDSYPLYAGTASQTVGLLAGESYHLTFAQSDFPFWDHSNGLVGLNIQGGAWSLNQNFVVPNGTGWLVQSQNFTITGLDPGTPVSTTFTFTAFVGNPAILDDIRLQSANSEIPEASTYAAGILVLALAAWGHGRRTVTRPAR